MEWLRFPGSLALLIPILALLIPIVAIVAGVSLKWRREQLRHDTIRLLAERGQPIPNELLAGDADAFARAADGHVRGCDFGRHALHRGIMLIAIGGGLALMFWIMEPMSWLWAIGMIPLFLGVGHILIWSLDARQRGNPSDRSGPAP